MSAVTLPPDGGASFIAGWGSAEVAIVALGAFLVCYVIAAFASATWMAEVAFLLLVVGGLLVTWPVMILLTGSALLVATIVGVAHRILAPKRAARAEAEAAAISADAVRRALGVRDRDTP